MTVKHPEVPSGAPPSATVLAAFDLKARPVPLPGGQGRSWLVGQVALKPLDMPLSARSRHTSADLQTYIREPVHDSRFGSSNTS